MDGEGLRLESETAGYRSFVAGSLGQHGVGHLIGARRWLAGRPKAYIDLTSGAVVPHCGSVGVRLATPQGGGATSVT